MTSISFRHPFDGFDSGSDRGPSGQDGTGPRFDYSKLLRGGGMPHRPVSRALPREALPSAPLRNPLSGEDEKPERQPADEEDRPLGEAFSPSLPISLPDPELAARITHAAEPVVSSVLTRQQRILHLVGTLAHQIAGFCGDPAIAGGGNWEVQMRLDERLFPNTTLYLTLSRFAVHLRFDALDSKVKQLLLDHSPLLQRELDATLRAWSEPRDIQLTVW